MTEREPEQGERGSVALATERRAERQARANGRGQAGRPNRADRIRAHQFSCAVWGAGRVADRPRLAGSLHHPAQGRQAFDHADRSLRRPSKAGGGNPPLCPAVRARGDHRPGFRPQRRRSGQEGFSAGHHHGAFRLGAGVFLKDVWPEAVYIPYFEWHYNWPVPDQTPYDPERNPLEGRARNHARNAPMWMDFSPADCCLCPTEFQSSQFPPWLRARLTVMHDGVDTDLHSPGDGDRSILGRWGVPDDAEILTSITRGMEPHRGFPETMRAIALLQKRRPASARACRRRGSGRLRLRTAGRR